MSNKNGDNFVATNGNTQWYAAKADIDGDLNPAHIIRECLTDSNWGLGYTTDRINEANFQAAADTLYDEDFGLSFVWDSTGDIVDFIDDVTGHIDGILYVDIKTGQFNLKLARDDYVAGDLESFDESEIIELEDYTQGSYGEVANQVVVEYKDRATNDISSATDQDIAMINKQEGNIIPAEFSYHGITNGTLTNKVVARELRQVTSIIAKGSILCNRKMAHLLPGDVFKLNWAALDIEDMIVRIIQVNYGSLTDGKVRIDFIQDVFSTATALNADPPENQWTDPVNIPAVSPYRELFETPYWVIARGLLGDSLTSQLNDNSSFLTVCASSPSGDAYDYEVLVRDTASLPFNSYGREAFTPTATLTADLPLSVSSATISLSDIEDLDLVETDTFALIGNEIVAVTAVSDETNRCQYYH